MIDVAGFRSMVLRIRALMTSIKEYWIDSSSSINDQRDGMEARLFGTADAAMGVLVEAELLSSESGGVATDAGDFDMSAAVIVGH